MSSDRNELFSYELQDEGDLRLQFREFSPHPTHQAPTYHFRMVHVQTGEELGGINLRIGFTPPIKLYAGHVGYTVNPEHRGRHYAMRSLRILLPLAQRLGLRELWVTCDPENAASRRTAELAGGVFVELVDVPAHCVIRQSGHKQKCRYRIDL